MPAYSGNIDLKYSQLKKPMKLNLQQGLDVIAKGGVIAYPTETTFGLGCDAFNKEALERLATIKQRLDNKGFIVLINNFKQSL